MCRHMKGFVLPQNYSKKFQSAVLRILEMLHIHGNIKNFVPLYVISVHMMVFVVDKYNVEIA